MSECKYPGCTKDRRNRGDPEYDGEYTVSTFGSKFCSVKHEVKYEHIKADAEDARRAEEKDNEESSRF